MAGSCRRLNDISAHAAPPTPCIGKVPCLICQFLCHRMEHSHTTSKGQGTHPSPCRHHIAGEIRLNAHFRSNIFLPQTSKIERTRVTVTAAPWEHYIEEDGTMVRCTKRPHKVAQEKGLVRWCNAQHRRFLYYKPSSVKSLSI